MPHPTPVQIAYGSATVISITFVALLLAPGASGVTPALIAAGALLLGVVVAVAAQARRTARRRAAAPVRRPGFNAPDRPKVRV